jgi:hypothetical protein
MVRLLITGLLIQSNAESIPSVPKPFAPTNPLITFAIAQ